MSFSGIVHRDGLMEFGSQTYPDQQQSQFQVYDECDNEVAEYMRKRTQNDICLCKKYGQSKTIGRRCPVCQDVIPLAKFRHRNRPHVPPDTGQHHLLGAAKAMSPVYRDALAELEQIAEEQILEFDEDTRQSHKCVKPRLISAYDFLDRYYLSRSLEADFVDQPMVPKSLERYFVDAADALIESVRGLHF